MQDDKNYNNILAKHRKNEENKRVSTIVNLTEKVYHPKSVFWKMGKFLEIGRGWPEVAGTAIYRFAIIQLDYLTHFHNKIMLRSLILKILLT